MNYCPLMSYAKQYAQEIPCLGEECALAADGAGECLIKQALQLYVSSERTRRAEEAEKAKREMEMALAYWENKKNSGFRKAEPLVDMSPCYDNDPNSSGNEPLQYRTVITSNEVQLSPPQIDRSYIYF